MKKTNLKALLAGTTVLFGMALTGMNNLPIGQCDKALAAVTPTKEEKPTATGSTNESSSKDAERQAKSGIYEDQTKIKDENGNETTVGEYAKNADKYNDLGIAGMFHIFSKETSITNHVKGNVATDSLDAPNNFGEGTDEHSRLIDKNVYYAGDVKTITDSSFEHGANNYLVVGKDVDTDINNENSLEINGSKVSHLYKKEWKKEDENKKFIDIDEEFKKLNEISDKYTNQKQSAGIEFDFKNENNRTISIENAKSDNNKIYIDLDAKYISDNSRQILIKGISSDKNAPTVVVNVKNSDKELTVSTKAWLFYDGSSEKLENSESHKQYNKVLWNFGTDIQSIYFSNGTFMGSILAPNATITINENVDGNIVGKKVNAASGESHEWNLFPNYYEVAPTDGDQDNNNPSDNRGDNTPDGNTPGKDDNDDTPDHDDNSGNKSGQDDHGSNEGDHDSDNGGQGNHDDSHNPSGDNHDENHNPDSKDHGNHEDNHNPGDEHDDNTPDGNTPGTDDHTPSDSTPDVPTPPSSDEFFEEPHSKTILVPESDTPSALHESFDLPQAKTPFSDSQTDIDNPAPSTEDFFAPHAKNDLVTKKTNKKHTANKTKHFKFAKSTDAKTHNIISSKGRKSMSTLAVKNNVNNRTPLPQTGEKKNNIAALIGLALGASALLIGAMIRSRKE